MTERRGARARYGRPQQLASRRTGSSFTIKNILNLPDDSNDERTEPMRHPLVFDKPTPPTHQLINASPRPPSASQRINRSADCWPCRPWIVTFNSQFSPLGLGGTEVARDAGLNLGDENDGLKLCRRRPTRKKKQRPLFSPQQVQTMEKEFDSRKYLTEGKRAELAVGLKLTETQVKTWFQNRRTKWRKELRNENPPRAVPDGRLKHSLGAWK